MATPSIAASTVLITGSSSGFGRLTAEALARRGHTVFASMRGTRGKNEQAAGQLRAWAVKEGLALHVVELDVTDDASVEAATQQVLALAPRLDAVVNNAGLGAFGPLEAFTVEEMQAVFDVDVFGAVRVNRAVLPHMRRNGSGLLVHVSSVVGRLCLPLMGVLCASKFALEALAESYRFDLTGLGVDSVIVEPGAFPTEAGQKVRAPADAARVAEYGRFGVMPESTAAQLYAKLGGPSAPDARMIADAIVKLIETPFGQRPLRTAIDTAGDAVERLNAMAEPYQEQLLRDWGWR